mmetsp:Transcript_25277/g.72877  ORF Transcript_25277/g.72877 Transcript_25277/m.72877 type:complete len:280 (+) Transcript_25277:210-1049(+)
MLGMRLKKDSATDVGLFSQLTLKCTLSPSSWSTNAVPVPKPHGAGARARSSPKSPRSAANLYSAVTMTLAAPPQPATAALPQLLPQPHARAPSPAKLPPTPAASPRWCGREICGTPMLPALPRICPRAEQPAAPAPARRASAAARWMRAPGLSSLSSPAPPQPAIGPSPAAKLPRPSSTLELARPGGSPGSPGEAYEPSVVAGGAACISCSRRRRAPMLWIRAPGLSSLAMSPSFTTLFGGKPLRKFRVSTGSTRKRRRNASKDKTPAFATSAEPMTRC